MKLSTLKAFALLFSLLAFSLPSRSQQVVGAITGTVIDPAGAAVPDATVKATNTATNLEVTAQTKSNGSYVVPELPGGTYQLTIEGLNWRGEPIPQAWATISIAH